jgi:hypothetical protein
MDKKADFDKFYKLLGGKEGCNFKGNGKNLTWVCHSDFRFTRKILKEHFPKEKPNRFIQYCKDRGGYCDCEIFLNVANGEVKK